MDEVPGVASADLSALCGTVADVDDMTVTVLRDADSVSIIVTGEIDLLTVPRLSDTLSSEMAEKPSILVVDLDGVSFLSSVGITALALAEREARKKKINLRVVASGRITLRPLQITGMTEQLAVYASRPEALGRGGTTGHAQRGR
jgi:anti-anti-sigma factor